MTRTFDINCDMGESFGNWSMGADEAMMPHITTANVACGYHGGDPLTMRRTIRLAAEHGVAVGAHPGLPDLMGFGRRAMAVDGDDAAAYVTYQAGALRAFLDAEGLPLHHVKPHGAFFSVLRDDAALAEPVAEAIAALGDDVLVYWPQIGKGAPFTDALAARGVEVVGEIYPDLSYAPDGALQIQRTKRETDVDFAAAQIASHLQDGTVAAEDGSRLHFEARSACVHGDGPNAVAVAQALEAAVRAAGAEPAAVRPA